jgi:hypothetical protein
LVALVVVAAPFVVTVPTAASLASPTIVTTASPPTTVGLQIFDNANLSGGVSPTGTITVTLFGPKNPACTGSPTFSSTVSVTGDGSYNSGHFTTSQAGTYQWMASYSGDANNGPAGPTSCTDPNESVTVAPFTTAPTIVTSASGSVPIGGSISDTATLAGGVHPTGTITFTLFGPNDASCIGAPVFTSTKAVIGNGVYPSDLFTPAEAGLYNWIAIYSGDSTNVGVTSPCGAANESVTVTKAASTTTLSSSPNPSVFGRAVAFIATVVTPGGPSLSTGTVTFNDGAFVLGVLKVSGGQARLSLTSLSAGTHVITASYSGDTNVEASNSNSVVQVVQRASTTLVAEPTRRLFPHFSATLTRSFDGLPLAGQVVTFSATGTVICSATTDTSGKAACAPILGLVIGPDSYTGSYGGSANYQASTGNGRFTGII